MRTEITISQILNPESIIKKKRRIVLCRDCGAIGTNGASCKKRKHNTICRVCKKIHPILKIGQNYYYHKCDNNYILQ